MDLPVQMGPMSLQPQIGGMNPQMAQPGGMMPVNQPAPFDIDVRDVYDDLSPGLLWLKDQIAPQFHRRKAIERYFDPELIGQDVQTIAGRQRMGVAAETAMQDVEGTMEMSDDEFAQVLAAMDQAIAARPTGYPSAPLQAPGREAMALSFLFGQSDPNRAFEYGAVPFQHQLGERDRNTEIALRNMKLADDQARTRLDGLSTKAQLINQRDMAEFRALSQAKIAEMNNITRELIAEGRGREARFKQLMDGWMGKGANSSPDIREGARRNLVAEFGYDPGPAADLTPGENVKNSQFARNNQAVVESQAKIERWGVLNEKTHAEIDLIGEKKGLTVQQRNLLAKRVAWFDRDMQKKIATADARIERMRAMTAIGKEMMEFRWADSNRDAQMQAHKLFVDSLETQINSYDEQAEQMERALRSMYDDIQYDQLMNRGQNSPEGLALIKQYQELHRALNDPGGVRSTLNGYRDNLKTLERFAPQIQGQGAGGRPPQAGQGGVRWERGPDGTVRQVSGAAPSSSSLPTQFKRGPDGSFQPISRGGQRVGRASRLGSRGGTRQTSDVVSAARSAGFTDENLVTAVAVALAESGGNPSAHNTNAGTGDDSVGLWQINYFGKLADARTKRYGDKESLKDPVANAKAAYHMSGGGKNWRAWTTYTSGKYKQYLEEARRLVGGQ